MILVDHGFACIMFSNFYACTSSRPLCLYSRACIPCALYFIGDDLLGDAPSITVSDNLFGIQRTPTAPVLNVRQQKRRSAKRRKVAAKDRLADTLHADSNAEDLHDADAGSPGPLKWRQLTVGTQLWGCVRRIDEFDVVVSLPGGLTGYLSLREASDVMARRVDAFIGAHDVGNNDDHEAQAAVDAIAGRENDADRDDALPPLRIVFRIGQLIRVLIAGIASAGDGQRKGRRLELTMRHFVAATWTAEDLG